MLTLTDAFLWNTMRATVYDAVLSHLFDPWAFTKSGGLLGPGNGQLRQESGYVNIT